MVTRERLSELPFQAHLELLQSFLARRDEIVERIQGVLNAQRKPIQYLEDGSLLTRRFEDCFFAAPGITGDQSRLRGQLEELHWASGFRPRVMPGMHNDLISPAEMMIRGFHLWQRTRWPGRSGRLRYAHTLFNAYLLRCLELLSMRLWDAGSSRAADRLARVQGVLDRLWRGSPADQPVFVRDARWLIPLAQSPTTDELAPYFDVAERVAESLPQDDRIEVCRAAVQMAGGHLRSQLRHYCIKKSVPLDDNDLILSSRNSNALDFAVLIQGLVPLLEAYERATRDDGRDDRIELAGAICQGISVDPQLFVNRIDLLGAYSMIEHLFITTDGEITTDVERRVAYTPMGRRHVQLLQQYAALMNRLSQPLYADSRRFRPVAGAYSPYGIIYGFSSNITEHMALKAVQPDAATRFSLEDAFVDGNASADKLAWVSGWRKLPHIDPNVQKQFEYPQRFAEEIFDRVENALHGHISNDATAVVRTGRLFIVPENDPRADARASLIPELPVRYIRSSDMRIVAAQRACACDQARLLSDRREGMFVVSYETADGWVALTKDILTEVLRAGRDARVTGLPGVAVRVLSLMCPDLVIQSGT